MTTQEKVMTTQEIANRLVALCREGQYEKAQKELYAEAAESIEAQTAREEGWDATTKGLDNIVKKGEQWQNTVEQYHGGEVSEPLIAGDYIAFKVKMDITMKGSPRSKIEEICVYRVKNGKIISEQFFY